SRTEVRSHVASPGRSAQKPASHCQGRGIFFEIKAQFVPRRGATGCVMTRRGTGCNAEIGKNNRPYVARAQGGIAFLPSPTCLSRSLAPGICFSISAQKRLP